MKEHIHKSLNDLFELHFGHKATKFERLPISGSNRKYFRIEGEKDSVVGTYNEDSKENIAFLTLSKHFREKGLSVPLIIAEDIKNHVYLQEDLGDITLYEFLTEKREKNDLPIKVVELYKKVIEELIRFQIVGAQGINYDICYPRPKFDKQSMMWDLNYFKYYFIKLADVPFYEEDLEKDFNSFTDFLLGADLKYFLYRDFQSRNIMLKEGELYFIDYQGGREGALYYDLASLLFDAKADLPQKVRNELLEHYIKHAGQYLEINRKSFIEYYYGYALMRIMQAFGAFGFRGFYEGKQHFLLSIPYALNNLKWILENYKLPVDVPELITLLNKLIESPSLKELSYKPQTGLTVRINSFAYKRTLPVDNSGNGGGFIFDCRSLPNPGRIEKYQALTGLDIEVQEFMSAKSEVKEFLKNVFRIIDNTIDKYLERDFRNLMVSFGCTGGQHRSVYCAHLLARHLQKKGTVKIVVKHIEQERLQNE